MDPEDIEKYQQILNEAEGHIVNEDSNDDGNNTEAETTDQEFIQDKEEE
jgi:hypothetical protein